MTRLSRIDSGPSLTRRRVTAPFFFGSKSYVVFGYLCPDLETRWFCRRVLSPGESSGCPLFSLTRDRERVASLGSKSGQSPSHRGGLAAALPPSSDFVSQNFAFSKFFYIGNSFFYHLFTEIVNKKCK